MSASLRSLDGDVFWSADGLEWEQTTDPTGDLAIRDLAANERGFVEARDMPATTSEPASLSGRVTTALLSPDGRIWEIVDVGAPAAFFRSPGVPAARVKLAGRWLRE